MGELNAKVEGETAAGNQSIDSQNEERKALGLFGGYHFLKMMNAFFDTEKDLTKMFFS